jgi:hypothetical protein
MSPRPVASTIPHYRRGGVCNNAYLIQSRVDDGVIDWHKCQLKREHDGWCECWCGAIFDTLGVIAPQTDMFRVLWDHDHSRGAEIGR